MSTSPAKAPRIRDFQRKYKTPNYDPAPIARKVRTKGQTPDVTIFVTKSFTNPENDDRYNPVIEANGDCRCTCPDFQFKLARMAPKAWAPWTMCKHLLRAAANLERKGVLPQKPACALSEAEIDDIIDWD